MSASACPDTNPLRACQNTVKLTVVHTSVSAEHTLGVPFVEFVTSQV